MIGGVIGLVRTGGDAAADLPGLGLEHPLCGATLGGAIGVRDHAGHRQSMPVFHDGVAHIGEFGVPPGGLAVKPAVGIAGTGMRIVLALLAMEVRAIVILAATVLGTKA